MPSLPEKCFGCPDAEGCPEFQEAFDRFYDEVQQELEAQETATARMTGWISIHFFDAPVGDDNDPACRGIYLHLSDAPPDDHHGPSAQL